MFRLIIVLLFFDNLFGDINNLVLTEKLIILFCSFLFIFHSVSRTRLFFFSLSLNFFKTILQIVANIHLVLSSQFGKQVHNAIILFCVDWLLLFLRLVNILEVE